MFQADEIGLRTYGQNISSNNGRAFRWREERVLGDVDFDWLQTSLVERNVL